MKPINKKLTIQEAIRILPMDKALREKYLAEWSTYDDDKRSELSDRIWGLLGEYQSSLQDVFFTQLEEDVVQGKQKLIGNLGDLAIEKVWAHYKDVLDGKFEETEEISKLRNELRAAMAEK